MGAMGDVELVLLDLDGTVYEGTRAVPGAAEAVGRLRRAGFGVGFLTNTDSVPPRALVERLAGMGVEAVAEEILTPVTLAQRLFHGKQDARVLALAAPEVRAVLGDALAKPGERPTHVLVCDPSFGATYDDLDAAFRAVRAGAELVASQLNRVARRDDGEHLDTGGFVRLLEYAAGVQARVLGKPSAEFFHLALEAAGVEPGRALVVGDDLESDVGGAGAVGVRAVLVRTGKGADPRRAGGADPGRAGGVDPRRAGHAGPAAVLDSLADLPDLLGAEEARPERPGW
jgi:HAD superfamily hydrolase (TIGR01458 family)